MDEIEINNILFKWLNASEEELLELCGLISSDEETETEEEETETEIDSVDVTESEEELFSDEEKFMQRKKARYI